MGNCNGMVTADDDGQGISSIQRAHKDFYIYDIVHDGTSRIEVSKEVDLTGPFMYRITVDETGYYLLRANVPDEDSIYNAETGETRELTGYFMLRDKKGIKIEKYCFDEFRDTLEGKDESGNIKRPVRYMVIMYLKKKVVYTGNLFVQSPKNTDKSCILRLSPNIDLYQYDTPLKNENDAVLPEYPRMNNGIITKVFEDKIAIVQYKSGLGNVGAQVLFRNRISGLNCCLMWSIDENLVNDFSKPLPLTVTNIFYIDQMLGGYLYSQLSYMKNDAEYKNLLKDKIINAGVGAGEITISTGVPSMLVELGIITKKMSTPAGVLICICFLFMHAFESPSELDKHLQKLHQFMIQSDNILNTPVALIFKTQTAIYKEPWSYLDPPGPGPESQILSVHEFEVEPWDGTLYAAGGAELQTGKFTFDHYSELSKSNFIDKLEQEVGTIKKNGGINEVISKN